MRLPPSFEGSAVPTAGRPETLRVRNEVRWEYARYFAQLPDSGCEIQFLWCLRECSEHQKHTGERHALELHRQPELDNSRVECRCDASELRGDCVAFGRLKLTLLNTLKNSARNSVLPAP